MFTNRKRELRSASEMTEAQQIFRYQIPALGCGAGQQQNFILKGGEMEYHAHITQEDWSHTEASGYKLALLSTYKGSCEMYH